MAFKEGGYYTREKIIDNSSDFEDHELDEDNTMIPYLSYITSISDDVKYVFVLTRYDVFGDEIEYRYKCLKILDDILR